LSGKLRSFLGGYRIEGRLNWERLTNTQNLADVVNKAVVGTEKLFWVTNPDSSYTSNIIAISPVVAVDDYFKGMKADFNGANARTITNYYSNGQVRLNASVTTSDIETMNIYALSNMSPTVFLYPDATNVTNEEVILDDTTWELAVESTVIRQPLSVSFMGSNVSNTIPSYYSL